MLLRDALFTKMEHITAELELEINEWGKKAIYIYKKNNNYCNVLEKTVPQTCLRVTNDCDLLYC